jgi:hypothetical protein
MNTGSYFNSLISSDLSYQVDYVAAQSQNMEMLAFYGVGKPDDTPPSNELPQLDDAHAARKEKKEQKNQC